MPYISKENFSELKSIFIGELTDSAKVWPTPVKEPHLYFSGDAVRLKNSQWVLDFGSVAAGVTVKKLMRIENLGQEDLKIDVTGGAAAWCEHRWLQGASNPGRLPKGGGVIDLEVIFKGREFKARELEAGLAVHARGASTGASATYTVNIKVRTHTNVPYGVYDFNGRQTPDMHDFGVIDPQLPKIKPKSYRLSIRNVGGETLAITLSNAPDWLKGLLDGDVFEKQGRIEIKPQKEITAAIAPISSVKFLGRLEGAIRFETNDMQPQFQKTALPFRCVQEIQGPYVRFKQPQPLELFQGQKRVLKVPVYNFGNAPAKLQIQPNTPCLKVGEHLALASKKGDNPGRGVVNLTVSVNPRTPLGEHTFLARIKAAESDQKLSPIKVKVGVIGIECSPDPIDFGVVNAKEESPQVVVFKASDGRDLSLKAAPLPKLEGVMDVAMIKGNVASMTLRYPPTGPNEYNEPGVVVKDHSTGYTFEREVKFKRTVPFLEVQPHEIDAGEIIGGGQGAHQFKIFNRGDGDLRASLNPSDGHCVIQSGAEIKIAPAAHETIRFKLDFKDKAKITSDESVTYTIEVNSHNDPRINTPLNVTVKAVIIKTEGKICAVCALVASLDHTYCPSCGSSMADANIATAKDVVVCEKCGLRFSNAHNFCPIHGKALKPIA